MIPRDVKHFLGSSVRYNGAEYILRAYILRAAPNGLIHAAELLDRSRNSIIEARLEDVNVE